MSLYDHPKRLRKKDQKQAIGLNIRICKEDCLPQKLQPTWLGYFSIRLGQNDNKTTNNLQFKNEMFPTNKP